MHSTWAETGRGKPIRLNPVAPRPSPALVITALLARSGTHPVRAGSLRRQNNWSWPMACTLA